MNIVIWLLAGGMIGWITGRIMRTEDRQENLLNIAVGVVGAAFSGSIISRYAGMTAITQGNFNLPSLLVALAGSIILVAMFVLSHPRVVR
jgi:uncharacterized membrane protein YeaQ/YmgE (transglycosylase-associated protein family)